MGGLGNDFMVGFDGSDTYVYKSGDGNDEILDSAFSSADQDTLKLTDLTAARNQRQRDDGEPAGPDHGHRPDHHDR